jgi:hypothetical protein
MLIDGYEHGRCLMHFSVENHDFSSSLAIDPLCLNVFFHQVEGKAQGKTSPAGLDLL